MKNYVIIAKQVTYYKTEVFADSVTQAKNKVDSIDYDDFKELPEIDFEVYDIYEKD